MGRGYQFAGLAVAGLMLLGGVAAGAQSMTVVPVDGFFTIAGSGLVAGFSGRAELTWRPQADANGVPGWEYTVSVTSATVYLPDRAGAPFYGIIRGHVASPTTGAKLFPLSPSTWWFGGAAGSIVASRVSLRLTTTLPGVTMVEEPGMPPL
jgi:hypothetical protein